MKNRPPKPVNNFWYGASFPLPVAHRGGDGAGIEKENTMAAFQAAYELGYRWFETDVVPTKDGKLLAIHGRGLQRKPNKDLPSRLKIQRTSYKEAIKNIQVGGEKLVTLDELLDTFFDVKFFLDPKTLKAASALAKNLNQRPQDLNRIWVGSFLPFNNARVYRAVKKVHDQQIGLAILGPLKAFPIKLATSLPIFKPLTAIYVKWTKAQSVRVPYRWVTGKQGQKFVHISHFLGLKVGVYTPNSHKDIEASIAHGADVIMSDNLKLLKSILKF